jgi:hypothetical protein
MTPRDSPLGWATGDRLTKCVTLLRLVVLDSFLPPTILRKCINWCHGKTAIKQKLNMLEAEVRALRLAIRRPVDLTIDDANWQRLKAASECVRRTLFKKLYG